MREQFHKVYGPRRTSPIKLPGMTDREFEQFVYRQILRELSELNPSPAECSVQLTPRSADQGRDIVIRNFRGDSLLGLAITNRDIHTIFVECKLCGGSRLSFEHVAANLLQIEREDRSAFLLVTNATLTPRGLGLIQRRLRSLDTRFLLIDAHNFDRHFPGVGSQPVLDQPAATRSGNDGKPLLQVSYQVFRSTEQYGRGFSVHIVVRSFQESSIDVAMSLHSTREWGELDGDKGPLRLQGDDVACFTLQIIPRKARISETVKLVFYCNGRPELFDVHLSNHRDLVELPLLGRAVREAVDGFDRRLRMDLAPPLLLLHGPSGIGKTRFVREVAKRAGNLGYRTLWFRMHDNGSAFVLDTNARETSRRRQRAVPQREVIQQVGSTFTNAPGQYLAVIDDMHMADDSTLDELEAALPELVKKGRLILAGRSDPLIRRPRYEGFMELLGESGRGGEEIVLSPLTDADVQAALAMLIPDHAFVSPVPSGGLSVKAVDLVHWIHSLLERGFIRWIDENRLGLTAKVRSGMDWDPPSMTGAAEVLQYRFEYLDQMRVESFTIADAFLVLSTLPRPQILFLALEQLRTELRISEELVGYWFQVDTENGVAFPSHDTIKEFLKKRFYAFDKPRPLGKVLERLALIAGELSLLEHAAIHVHDRDLAAAVTTTRSLALRLKAVRNISSLDVRGISYDDLATFIYVLMNTPSKRPRLVSRAIVARAYLNTHERDFGEGFFDCIQLLSLTGTLPAARCPEVVALAVRQLLAHGLLNGGDLRTALTLMHEVENSIRNVEPCPLSLSVEFDMCDRLQSYYAQQSAFTVARGFLFRGRSLAYKSGDNALVNINLSAEFHLHRYLDVREAMQMAERLVRHADEFAPLRSRMHARVNHIVARWALSGPVAPDGSMEVLDDVRAMSERSGFGHLIPRIDYLKAVHAYHELDGSDAGASEMRALIAATQRSARRYGYLEYAWLAENLRLMQAIRQGEEPRTIVEIAELLVDDLARNGLSYVAEDYVCYQSVVVLSNALRAIYTFADEELAWNVADRIVLSPLVCYSPQAREEQIRNVFAGKLLCANFDPAAVTADRNGFYTILA